ncbi:MAG: DUF89 family protein [Lentisphaeria bacterium]|nr:DUF89 family protein [Lentisphaeria bacterium]
MKITSDCYECILRQVVPLARKSGSEEKTRRLVREMLAMIGSVPPETTPPEIAAELHKILFADTGHRDLFREEKDISTQIALQLLPEMQQLAASAEDPFAAAVKLAIGGNIIDYGCNPDFDLQMAERLIREVPDLPVDRGALEKLWQRIEEADSIFYILDNCGEAVLDRLLLEYCRGKVTIGVRGKAIYNDVTVREAEMSGLTDFPVIHTGDMTPGVSSYGTSAEFQRAMRSADLVIAKGQGNFESLDEYDRPIAYLFRVKCKVIARLLQQEFHSLQVILRNV